MIRHLRWKVVATNMLLISLVLLAVFAAVNFISRGNYHKNVQQQLYQALEQGDYGRSQPGMDSIPCFVAEVYGSGTVRVAGNSYYDLSDETRMAEIVTAALAADEDAGTLDEFHLRYLRQRGYTTTAIAYRYLSGIHLPAHTAEGLLSGGLRRTGGAVSVQLPALRCGYQACRCRLGPAGAVPLRRQP